MKKLLAFTLVLTLLFTLAACGGGAVPSSGSDTESASTAPAPDEALPENVDAPPEPSDSTESSQASNTDEPDVSSTPPETSTPDTSSTPDASSDPVGGTIPMPDGFPSNPGDAEYFSFQTDDYALAKTVNVTANADQEIDSGVMMFCFDADGNTVAVYEKWIMSSESDAAALSQTITDRSNWVNSSREVAGHNQIGNVIFMSWGTGVIDYYGFGTKAEVLGYTNVNTDVSLSDFYFSKP